MFIEENIGKQKEESKKYHGYIFNLVYFYPFLYGHKYLKQ